MYMYVYICLNVNLYVSRTHTHIYTHIHVYMHMCIHQYTHTHSFNIHTPNTHHSWRRWFERGLTPTAVHAHTHTLTHSLSFTHNHARTYTHQYTHTHFYNKFTTKHTTAGEGDSRGAWPHCRVHATGRVSWIELPLVQNYGERSQKDHRQERDEPGYPKCLIPGVCGDPQPRWRVSSRLRWPYNYA